MNTCAYCGSELTAHYCPFCEMELSRRYICQNGERLDNSIDTYPDLPGIFKNTPELLKLETIELLGLLHKARSYRSKIYNLRILTHKAKDQGGDMTEIDTASYSDYETATRKVWVIENIIKDRVGYFPKKVNDDFIANYLGRIKDCQKKTMTIKKAVRT